jgi:HSP20 family protein
MHMLRLAHPVRPVAALLDELLAPAPNSRRPAPAAWPALAVEYAADAVHVHLEVPGMKADDLEITLERELLTVKGTKQVATHVADDNTGSHYSEIAAGSFQRSVRLGSDLEADSASATLADGVLAIRVPRSERAAARRIAIRPPTS